MLVNSDGSTGRNPWSALMINDDLVAADQIG